MNTIAKQFAMFWAGLTGLIGRIVGSRKMIILIISTGVIVAKAFAPELDARIDLLGFILSMIGFALGGGVVLELGDYVKAWKERPTQIMTVIGQMQAELEALKKPTITVTSSSGSGRVFASGGPITSYPTSDSLDADG